MWRVALAVTVGLLGWSGCCGVTRGGSEATIDSSAASSEVLRGSGPLAEDGTLTGEQGVRKLRCKGWTPVLEPATTESGPFRSTVFISATPDSITVNFVEYKDIPTAMLALTGMKSSENVASVRFGRTVAYSACPPPKVPARCQQAIEDLK